jgi:hypothetical protein
MHPRSCVTSRTKERPSRSLAWLQVLTAGKADDKTLVSRAIALSRAPVSQELMRESATNWRRGQRVRPYLSRCRLDSYNHRPDGFLDTQGRCLARKCRDLMVFKLFLSATKCSIDLYFSFTRISVCFTWIFVRQYRDVLEAMRF